MIDPTSRSSRSDDFLMDPTLLDALGYDPESAQNVEEQAAAEQAAKKKQGVAKRKDTRRRGGLRDAAGRVNTSISRAQANVSLLTKTAMTIVLDLQRLDKEVQDLIRQMSLGGSPDDQEAARELTRLKGMCAANARLASGALGAYRRMSNLSNFQLIVE